MSFQRPTDDEPQRSMTRAMDTVHKVGHHVVGHGFIKPRSVVVAHDELPSVGHSGGRRVACAPCESAANAAFNGSRPAQNPAPRLTAGQLVGSGTKLS